MMDMNDTHSGSDDTNGDGEGVWSPDIEQCFREALLLFPPCGRRKHILQEEGGGKMYGRNELIARHIMMRTGKSRTRKQVSSHIQVLARRKAKAEATTSSTGGLAIGSPSANNNSNNNNNNNSSSNLNSRRSRPQSALGQQQQQSALDVWNDRPVCTPKIRLVEFSAFIEYRCLTPPLAVMSTDGDPIGAQIPMECDQQQHHQLGQQNDLSSQEASSQIQISQFQQTIAPTTQTATTTTTYPLASNHQVPAQFNQATYQQSGLANNQLLQLSQKCHSANNNQQQPQQQIDAAGKTSAVQNGYSNPQLQQQQQHQQQQQQQQQGGLMRHAYVTIDFSQPANQRQPDKLDRVCASQLQDKFPEITGAEGFYQRGPPDAFYLIKFWVDLTNDYEFNVHDQNSFFGFTSRFETVEPLKDITCSTKVCSYGLQVVEKVEKIYGAFNSSNGRYSYDINRSPMCEFMIQFIKKLRRLPRSTQMNSVLENFTALQVITNNANSEILLCLAYVFEIPLEEPGEHQIGGGGAAVVDSGAPQSQVFKLIKD